MLFLVAETDLPAFDFSEGVKEGKIRRKVAEKPSADE